MTFEDFVIQLDNWGRARTPFFFLVDFEMKKPLAFKLDEVPNNVKYNFRGTSNWSPAQIRKPINIDINPVTVEEFKSKFDLVHQHLLLGDSYLTNLTFRTEIKINESLESIFPGAKAKYKLLYKDEFLMFSPETFLQVKDGVVFSYPMKGTIDASVANAESVLLGNKKEQAEHVTIVDLIRNDLSKIATNVIVTRFRYIDKIESGKKSLLQVSSEIQGNLTLEFDHAFGSMLKHVLPAGSISGAPKAKTVEIIQQAEKIERGYYTGVAGIFDGRVFDSGVMIRFIENNNGKLFYRSGGGITSASEWNSEYHEVIDKIYVPVN